MGPAYRKPLFGERAAFSALAIASFKRYWLLDVAARRGRSSRAAVSSQTCMAACSSIRRRTSSALDPIRGVKMTSSTDFEARRSARPAVFVPLPWLQLGAKVDYLTPSIGPGSAGRSIGQVFTVRAVPGLDAQPDFLRYEFSADVNLREPRGNPRRGGQYKVVYQRFDDRDLERYNFHRVDVDLQQYVPLLRDRRVIALRAFASTADAGAGQDVPFYYQRTLGGPDDLRGFRQFRFRDRTSCCCRRSTAGRSSRPLTARSSTTPARVAPRFEDLGFDDLESDYGIGFRFGTRNGVFLRVEGAFGSSGGKHFILRYGHVF